jgi:hypothetical protein
LQKPFAPQAIESSSIANLSHFEPSTATNIGRFIGKNPIGKLVLADLREVDSDARTTSDPASLRDLYPSWGKRYSLFLTESWPFSSLRILTLRQ